MRKSILLCTILAASLLNSCDIASSISSPVAGKTFYLLNIKELVVQETQLDFKSDNAVNAHFTLNANSSDCYTYYNTPSLADKSIVLHYTIENDILKIQELDLAVNVNQVENEDVFYKTSIVEHLNDSTGYKRILAHAYNESLVDMYMTMINNNAESSIGEEVLVEDPNGGRPRKTYKINSNRNANNPYKLNPLGDSPSESDEH